MSAAAHISLPSATEQMPLLPAERLTRPFQRFAQMSSAGGILLLVCTIVALAWSNSGFAHAYEQLFHHTEVGFEIGSFQMHHHLVHWINDALMAIFFLYVGLEIKRELLVGELNSVRKATLPVVAAAGGMVGPALIYAAFNLNSGAIHGWGTPMATDIAFALGMLTLLGSRVPNSLKIFLTSLAIADDLGALLVIAFFYTEQLNWYALGQAGLVLCILFLMNIAGFRRGLWYAIPGVFLWYFMFASGVHSTIAGVLLACAIPAISRIDADRYSANVRRAINVFDRSSTHGTTIESNADQRAAVYAVNQHGKFILPLLHRMEHSLAPWCIFLIIPVFALANAGTELHGSFSSVVSDPVALGVFFGLWIGKPLGIVAFAYLACRIGLAALPRGVTWRHMVGAGCFGGIGFTMALFIANLAFKGSQDHLDHAKLGIFAASLLATITGVVVILTCKQAPEPEPEALGPTLGPDADTAQH